MKSYYIGVGIQLTLNAVAIEMPMARDDDLASII